ncbi:hypothetical protein M199_gp162 [Halogranum tailed virus 1]|uniref:Uncharacterized protein n=1 Tax=Halogranum tailed virus 1 TaxID=1273749 RepID=R4T709_9CAUD|nr:hypothetical protein M199_gp162 [Halogranum tailed virus 1]AGM11504.1 hypothetical protein HGTV1_207 [Halogranum tailed virus 1]
MSRDYNLSELAEAEIVPNQGGPNAWLVRFGEGDYDLVSKTAKHRLILEDGVLDRDSFEYGGVTVGVNFQNDEYTLERGGDEVRVPTEKHEHVLWSLHDEDGPRLNKLFDELHVPTVRQGVMDMLMPRFREAKTDIRKTEDGWLVSGDILVSWDGSNHPVDVGQTHVVRGGDAVVADEDKQAREINFSLPSDTSVTLPNGTSTDLDEVEVKFLTTVGLILGRGTPGLYDDGLSQAIQDSRIVGFTDTKSGLHHGHGMSKHTLDMLGVTDEATERLWYNEYDHAGVHELYVRRNEFETAPIDVFEDAANDDPSKWSKIQNTSRKAPIPKSVRQDLESRYE